MKYIKYKKLRRYINGQPTDEYKKGEMIGIDEYDSLEDCESGSSPSIPGSFYTSFTVVTTGLDELVRLPNYTKLKVSGDYTESGQDILITKPGIYTIELNLYSNVLEFPEQVREIKVLDGVLDIFGYKNASYICSGDKLFKDRTSLTEVFKDCKNLMNVDDNIFQNCQRVTSMQNPFKGCLLNESKVTTIMSKITTLTNADYILAETPYTSDCGILSNNPNLTSINHSFENMKFLANIPTIPDYITYMNSAFSGCINMKGIAPDLWANPNIEGMNCFKDCFSLENYSEIPEYWGGTDLTNLILKYSVTVSSSASLSINCPSYTIDWGDGTVETKTDPNIFHDYDESGSYTITITSDSNANYITLYVPSSGFIDDIILIGNVVDLKQFGYPISIGSNVNKVCTSFDSLDDKFKNNSRLTTISENLVANPEAVTSLNNTFINCSNLTELPKFINSLINVTSVNSMAYNSGIESLDSNLFSSNKKITDFTECFMECNLTGSTPVDENGYKLWERAGKEGYPETIIGTRCFRGCTQLTDYNEIPDEWK